MTTHLPTHECPFRRTLVCDGAADAIDFARGPSGLTNWCAWRGRTQAHVMLSIKSRLFRRRVYEKQKYACSPKALNGTPVTLLCSSSDVDALWPGFEAGAGHDARRRHVGAIAGPGSRSVRP